MISQLRSAAQRRAEQSRAEQSRAEQSRAEQSRAEQSRAEQSRAEQSRAEQSRAEQSRAELDDNDDYRVLIECMDWLHGTLAETPNRLAAGNRNVKHVPRRFLRLGDAADTYNAGHVGAQPSVVRRALQSIGVTHDTVFIDLGSGKGRALIVASEFSFNALVGYELSLSLVNISRRNINKCALSRRVTIIQSDASKPELPSEAETIICILTRLSARLSKFLKPISKAFFTPTRMRKCG